MKTNKVKQFGNFLQKDTWQSWIISMILLVILIRFILFPSLSFVTASPLPLVVVESCSMYHAGTLDTWWEKGPVSIVGETENWYEKRGIEKEDFENFKFKDGLNKGDIIIVWNRGEKKVGDVIIFDTTQSSTAKHPIIHRVISEIPLATKGDNNGGQLTANNNQQQIDETDISESSIIGKSVARIPLVGWVKLIFFEMGRPASQRGLCK